MCQHLKIFLLASTSLLLLPYPVVGQDFLSAVSVGGPGFDQARGMAVADNGDILLTGSFNGTADFDPGPGVTSLVSGSGSSNVFFARYRPDGSLVWARHIASTGFGRGTAIAVEPGGKIYVGGAFLGTADFDPGAGTANVAASFFDGFVARYDANGNYEWVVPISGSHIEQVLYLDAVPDGGVVITGDFRSSTDFDPNFGGHVIAPVGSNDAYTARYLADGSLVWVNPIGTGGAEAGWGVSVDAAGDVFATGVFSGTALPGTSAGLTDAYVVRYDRAGSTVWANRLGGPDRDNAWSIVADGMGGAAVTGFFRATADVAGGPVLSSYGGEDGFLARFDATGAVLFATRFGGAGNERGLGLGLDGRGFAHVTGSYEDGSTFGDDSRPMVLGSNGGTDIFYARYSAAGALQSVSGVGASGNDGGQALRVGDDGTAHLSGFFQGAPDFNPGPDSAVLTSSGSGDIFIATFGRTAIGIVGELLDIVADLVDQGELNRGNGNSLSSKLDAAAARIESLNFNAAAGQVNAFLNQVDALVRSGKLSATAGDDLRASAESLLSLLGEPAKRNERAESYADLPSSDNLVLHQNYPNPFNPSTSIRFELSEASHVSLAVFDLTGREVARLVDSNIPAGSHSASWNAGSLPSGTYLYRVTTSAGSLTGRMVLLK